MDPSPEKDRDERGQLDWSSLGFSSVAVHAGEHAAPPKERPVTTPIYTAVGYEAPQAAELDAFFAGTRRGFTYLRHGNPTAAALEEAMARLEGGAGAVAFASGMAALHAACLAAEVRRDDVLVAGRDLYGATATMFRDVFLNLGVSPRYGDASAVEALSELMARYRPRVVFVEAMSNPLLRVPDIPRIAAQARAVGATLIVDATFVTPRLLKPLALGADLVVHSSTKFLNGHGDALGGIVVARDDTLATRLRHVARITGGVLGPFEAYLTLRGLKTLGVRLPRQSTSADRIARWLAEQPGVARVHYPGLASHPDHAVATRLFADGLFGAVVSFELRGGTRERVFRFMDALRLCSVAPTVGDIYSQLLYPAISSHRDLTPREREELGITDGLVRLSVGIEDPEDLVADLDQALSVALA